MEPVGRTTWAIPERYVPGKSHGPAPEMTSHEACCILNASEKDAHVGITIFFEDRDPVGPDKFTIPGRRCREQIRQTTDRQALHIAQVVQMAVNGKDSALSGSLPRRELVAA